MPENKDLVENAETQKLSKDEAELVIKAIADVEREEAEKLQQQQQQQ